MSMTTLLRVIVSDFTEIITHLGRGFLEAVNSNWRLSAKLFEPNFLMKILLAILFRICYYTFKAYILSLLIEHFSFQDIRKSMLGIQNGSN